MKVSCPPPRSTSGRVTLMYWRAISVSQLRLLRCAANDAGVAWVMVCVATSPVAMPFDWASSSRLSLCGAPSPWKQTSLFTNFSPQANAEAAAEESVMVFVLEYVR